MRNDRRYAKINLNMRNTLLQLSGDNMLKVLDLVLKDYNKATNIFHSTERFRTEASKLLNVSPATISNSLKKLQEKDILLKSDDLSRGEYRLNTRLVDVT
jgi:DNA-binding protein Fis